MQLAFHSVVVITNVWLISCFVIAAAMVFYFPWLCVADAAANPKVQPQQRSFAQVLSPAATTTAPLPSRTIKGDNLSIKITEDAYFKGLEKCKHHMHSRLFLNKGYKSYTAKEIFVKLSKQWRKKGPWHLISLGRGFYEFSFSSDEDMRTSLAMGTVNLKSCLLQLSRWSKDFNKYSQRLTHVQV